MSKKTKKPVVEQSTIVKSESTSQISSLSPSDRLRPDVLLRQIDEILRRLELLEQKTKN